MCKLVATKWQFKYHIVEFSQKNKKVYGYKYTVPSNLSGNDNHK